MPIYDRAGAIVPFDPIRQYTGQKVDEPMALKTYRGNSTISTSGSSLRITFRSSS